MSQILKTRIKKTLLSRRPASGSHLWPAALLLIFMVLSSLYWRGGAVSDVLSASREQVFSQHQYWRLFTTLGVHEDLVHFGSNSLLFFIFGYLLNGYFGALAFPILSVLFGAVINAAVLYCYPAHSVLVGASGVVYWMAGFWIALYLFVERTHSVGMRVLRSIGVVLVLLVPQEFQIHVSYLAHAVGFFLGILSGSVYFVFAREKIRSHEEFKLPEGWPIDFDLENDPEGDDKWNTVFWEHQDSKSLH